MGTNSRLMLSNFVIVGARDDFCQRCPEAVISNYAESCKRLGFRHLRGYTTTFDSTLYFYCSVIKSMMEFREGSVVVFT